MNKLETRSSHGTFQIMFVAEWLKHLVGVGPILNQAQLLVPTGETVVKQVESA